MNKTIAGDMTIISPKREQGIKQKKSIVRIAVYSALIIFGVGFFIGLYNIVNFVAQFFSQF